MKPIRPKQHLFTSFCILGAVVLLAIFLFERAGNRLFVNWQMLPAPLHDTLQYELHGTPQGIWGGNNFQLLEGFGKLHFVVLEGVDAPKEGQDFFQESRNALIRLINQKPIVVDVIRRDRLQREIGYVFVKRDELGPQTIEMVSKPKGQEDSIDPKIDVGYEIIRMGLGWHDGSDFDRSQRYRQAQAEAREMRRGLWSNPGTNPIWSSKETNAHKPGSEN